MPIHNSAIIFDLGGVLVRWERERLFRPLFNGNEAELEYFLAEVCSLEWNNQMDAGKPFAQGIAERVALFPQYREQIRAFHERWEEMIPGSIEGTVALLDELRQAGYPLYALSNWSAETYPRVCARFEFLGWFDQVLLSGEVGLRKPDPAIYRILLERVGRRAEECIFIDDTLENIHTAAELGFQVIHFHSPSQLRAALVAHGVGEVRQSAGSSDEA